MKSIYRLIVITALVVVIGLSFTACGDASGNNGTGGGTAPAITTTSLSGGTVGTVYSQTLTATGDTPITWSITTGTLPDGLTLTNGTISGTPTTAGTSEFTVKAANATGSSTKPLSITIASSGGTGTAPSITTSSLPNGTVGTAYTATLTVTGDTPITWSIDTGTLPNGLTLTNGTIAGTPTTANAFSFTVKATNATGSSTKPLSITIASSGGTGTAPTITTATPLPGGTVGTAYTATLTAIGDMPTWSIESGTLPDGLTLSTAGVISGTPTTANAFSFTVKAANATGSSTKQLSITIAPSGGSDTAPTITTGSLPDGTVGTAYTATLTATGDTPITWSLATGSSLPVGLTLSTEGVISGNPTTAVTSDFNVIAANATGSSFSNLLSITINTPIEMVQIEGGSFLMGKNLGTEGSSQSPLHTVTLTSFSMSRYEVTQAQYQAVMGSNPSSFRSNPTGWVKGNRPVENVTWYDAVEFCNKLSEREGLQQVYTISGRTPTTGYPITSATVTADWSKNGYRLPTEAQWEYAAKGGASPGNYTYSGSNTAGNVAWYHNNSSSYTHEIGKKQPNDRGLYDMSGNVWEWCWDWDASYTSEAQSDPTGPDSGDYRVARGGSWNMSKDYAQAVYRYYYYPGSRNDQYGFRLVRP